MLFIGQVVAFGTRASFGAYLSPWEQEFSADRAMVSSISMLSFVVFALGQVLAGKLNEQFGKSFIPTVSLFLMGVCLFLTSYADQIWQVFLFYGVGFSLGVSGCSNAVTSAITTNWFAEKRGFALGLVMSGLGVGQLILIPASLFMVNGIGWRTTMATLSIVIMLVVGPLFIFLLRSRPEEKGLRPYGYAAAGNGRPDADAVATDSATAPTPALTSTSAPAPVPNTAPAPASTSDVAPAPVPNTAPAPASTSDAAPVPSLLPVTGIFRLKAFWLISISYFICGFTDVGLIQTHLIPIVGLKGFPVSSAALAFSLIAVSNIAGTIVTGHLSDRVNRPRQLAGIYAIRAASYIFLILLNRPWQLPIFAVINGSMDMASIAPTNSLAVQLFDRYSKGTVLGVIAVSHQIGGAVGSWVPGVLFDWSGSYITAMTLSVFMLIGASLASLQIRENPAGTTG